MLIRAPSSPLPLVALVVILGVAPRAAAQASSTDVQSPAAQSSAQPGGSADREARALYLRGAAAYGDGQYAEAAAAFERAYALAPEASLLYNLALARQREGETERAIDAYERFLAANPDAPERSEVERSLESLHREQELQVQLAQQRIVPPEVSVRAAPPAASDEPALPSISPVPWVIAGVGVVSVLTGTVLGVLAQSAYDNAQSAGSHADSVSGETRADDLALGANVSFIAGGVLAAVGAIWGVLDVLAVGRARDSRRARLHIGLASVSLSVPIDL